MASSATHPGHAFQWIAEVEANGMDWYKLRESWPFYVLDVKLSQPFCSSILPAFPDLHREVHIEEKKAQQHGCVLTGRQTTCTVFRHFRLSASDGTLAELTELFEVQVKRGDVKTCFVWLGHVPE